MLFVAATLTIPLLQRGIIDNVIVSPHSASTVATENAALTDLFLDNLTRLTAGTPLRNPYDPARGY